MRAEESEPIRLDDLLAFRGDVKQDWYARTTIIFVGSLERQFCLFPLWLVRHDDSRIRSSTGPTPESVESPRDRKHSLPPELEVSILTPIHEDAIERMAKGNHTSSVSEHTALKRRKTEDDDSSNPQSKKARTRVRYVSLFSYTSLFSMTPQLLMWRMPSAQAKGSSNSLYTRRPAHHISLV